METVKVTPTTPRSRGQETILVQCNGVIRRSNKLRRGSLSSQEDVLSPKRGKSWSLIKPKLGTRVLSSPGRASRKIKTVLLEDDNDDRNRTPNKEYCDCSYRDDVIDENNDGSGKEPGSRNVQMLPHLRKTGPKQRRVNGIHCSDDSTSVTGLIDENNRDRIAQAEVHRFASPSGGDPSSKNFRKPKLTLKGISQLRYVSRQSRKQGDKSPLLRGGFDLNGAQDLDSKSDDSSVVITPSKQKKNERKLFSARLSGRCHQMQYDDICKRIAELKIDVDPVDDEPEHQGNASEASDHILAKKHAQPPQTPKRRSPGKARTGGVDSSISTHRIYVELQEEYATKGVSSATSGGNSGSSKAGCKSTTPSPRTPASHCLREAARYSASYPTGQEGAICSTNCGPDGGQDQSSPSDESPKEESLARLAARARFRIDTKGLDDGDGTSWVGTPDTPVPHLELNIARTPEAGLWFGEHKRF